MVITDAFTRAAEKAQALSERSREQIAAIQADGDLVPKAKAARIAEIRSSVNPRLREMHAAAEADLGNTLHDLRRQVFSPKTPWTATASDRIAIAANFRDALDRAQRVAETPKGLSDMLRMSILTSDTIQAKAVLAVAVEQRDTDVIQAFVAAHPEEEKTVSDFWSLQESMESGPSQIQRLFQFGGTV